MLIKGYVCPSVHMFLTGITHQKIKLGISKLATSFRIIMGIVMPEGKGSGTSMLYTEYTVHVIYRNHLYPVLFAMVAEVLHLGLV